MIIKKKMMVPPPATDLPEKATVRRVVGHPSCYL